jgi:hypothetical protein
MKRTGKLLERMNECLKSNREAATEAKTERLRLAKIDREAMRLKRCMNFVALSKCLENKGVFNKKRYKHYNFSITFAHHELHVHKKFEGFGKFYGIVVKYESPYYQVV